MISLSEAIPAYPRLILVVRTPWAFCAGLLFTVLLVDPAQFQDVFTFAVEALISTLPYILFAILMIAYLKATGAEVMVADAFKGNEVKMIIMAALFGGLMPFCSCEVIPFVAALLALNAPLSAIMAFWLSSPLIDPPTLLITAAALGWPFAIGKAIGAIFLGLLGGFTIYLLVRQGVFASPLRSYQSKSSCCSGPKMNGKPYWSFWKNTDRRNHFYKEFSSNGIFLLKWLSLAYVLESLMVFYVPSNFIVTLVGGEGVVPIATAAIVGMPTYLNSYVAPPLLAGLMEQGMGTGAAMAFMVAGSISSIPAMMAVWSLVKKQVFAAYISIGFIGAIISGIAFQIVI